LLGDSTDRLSRVQFAVARQRTRFVETQFAGSNRLLARVRLMPLINGEPRSEILGLGPAVFAAPGCCGFASRSFLEDSGPLGGPAHLWCVGVWSE